MRCISPLLVRTSNSRQFVPCGKCNFCLQVKRADWTFRIMQEWKVSSSAKFLTLTYTDQDLPYGDGVATLCKRDLQLFHKRLRKENEDKLRYYAVGEYGTVTSRPHYHSIMFNLQSDVIARLTDIWSLGMVHVGEVSYPSIHYVTKYVINRPGEYGGREPPFAFMSKRPGLGAHYLETHKEWHRKGKRNFTKVNGTQGRLPRYFKEKMFSAIERAQMAQIAIEEADAAYSASVDRLRAFHSDPYHYYDERVGFCHDGVKSKVNVSNLF